MLSLFSVLAQATRRWWYDWTVILLVSPLWLLAQLLIVTGPPATAVLFALMRRSVEQQYYGPAEAWAEFKRLFWPSWRWALANLVVVGIGLVNLSAYWSEPANVWFVLRLLWIAALSLWLALNLLYWPFWLSQSDRSMRNTYANASRFLLWNPLSGLALTLICFAILAVSAATVVLLALGALAWVALVLLIAVQRSIELSLEHASE